MLLDRHVRLFPAIQSYIAQKASDIVERFLIGSVEEACARELCRSQWYSGLALYLAHTKTGSGFLSGHSAALGAFLFDCPVACRFRIGCAVSKVLNRAEKDCISLCVVSMLSMRGDAVLSAVKLFVDIDLESGSQRHARTR